MSVHAQVQLRGPGAETAVAPELDVHGAEASGAHPDLVYKSGPAAPKPGNPAPVPAPQLHATEKPESARPEALTQVRVERVMPMAQVPRAPGREQELPQPLLAETPAPSVMPLVDAPLVNAIHDGDSRIRPDNQREPTEVHVHIGRIEVIAAPEPAAPKKPPKPATRPTVPLADYLARKVRP
jgi:hypothetical protein